MDIEKGRINEGEKGYGTKYLEKCKMELKIWHKGKKDKENPKVCKYEPKLQMEEVKMYTWKPAHMHIHVDMCSLHTIYRYSHQYMLLYVLTKDSNT